MKKLLFPLFFISLFFHTTLLIGQNPCSKNVLIYFDASESTVKEENEGEAVMRFMLKSLKEAINNKSLIRDGDYVDIKRFAGAFKHFKEIDDGFFADSAKRKEVSIVVDSLVSNYEAEKGSIIINQDNNYVQLAKTIRADILKAPDVGNAMNYIVIFSDFWYDPEELKKSKHTLEYREKKWNEHKSVLKKYLEAQKKFFADERYKIILIYEPNPKSYLTNIAADGTDIFEIFDKSEITRSIKSPGEFSDVDDNLRKEFIEPLIVDKTKSGFDYENGQLQLFLTLINPNCEAIKLIKLKTGKIVRATNENEVLAKPSIIPINETIDSVSITIKGPLISVIPYNDFEEEGLLGRSYRIPYTIETNFRDLKGSIDLKLPNELEKLIPKIKNVIVINNLDFPEIKIFDKLIYEINFKGNLTDTAYVIIKTRLRDVMLTPSEANIERIPIYPSDKIEQDTILIYDLTKENLAYALSKDSISLGVTFEIIRNNQRLDGSVLGLTPLENPQKRVVKDRDMYPIISWAIFSGLLVVVSFIFRNEIEQSSKLFRNPFIFLVSYSVFALVTNILSFGLWPLGNVPVWISVVFGILAALAFGRPLLLRFLGRNVNDSIWTDKEVKSITIKFWGSLVSISLLLAIASYYGLQFLLAVL